MAQTFCGNSSFWDSDYTLNGSWPRFTQCFQSTVLIYAPAGFLWVVSLFYIPYLIYHQSSTRSCNTPLSVAKTIMSLVLAAGSLAVTIQEVVTTLASSSPMPQPFTNEELFDVTTTAHLVARIIEVLCYIVTAVLVQLEKRACVVTSGVLFIYWLLQITCLFVPLYTYILLQVYTTYIFRFTVCVIKFIIVIAQFVVTCFADVQLYSCNRYIPLDRQDVHTMEVKAVK